MSPGCSGASAIAFYVGCMQPLVVAYCGEPPTPETLWTRWNFDPPLLAALAAGLAVGVILTRRASFPARAGFLAGWLAAALCFMSPLCALSVALFSARLAQHMTLTLIAAPLVAWALPAVRNARPLAAALLFWISLWLWHVPGPYAATFASDAVYWLMHVTLFGSAIWFWRACLDGERQAPGAAALALLLTALQMGLLGALLTLAPRALFEAHAWTTQPWGLSQLADQQLGGALMWAPGGLLFLGIALAIIHRTLRRLEGETAAGA